MGTKHSDLFYCQGTLAGWAGGHGSRMRGAQRGKGFLNSCHAEHCKAGRPGCRQGLERGHMWVLGCVWLLWMSPGLQPISTDRGKAKWWAGLPSACPECLSLPPLWHWPMCSSWCLGLWVGTQQLQNLSKQGCEGM